MWASMPRTIQRCIFYRGVLYRSLSSRPSERLVVDPSTLVTGVTKERIDTDETLAEYMQANFPEAFSAEASSPTEETKEIDIDNLFLDPVEEQAARKYEEKVRRRKERAESEKDRVYERNIRPLECYLRNPTREDGTRNCKRLRYQDKMIPGLLYGGDPTLGIYSHQETSKTFIKTPWRLLQRELDRYHRSFESRVYQLTVHDENEGTSVHLVTPQNVQRHPLIESIYCANFLRYHPKRPLKLPIRYINEEESPALKREGFMIPIQRYVECFVEDGADIPEAVDLECTGLLMKQVVRLDRLILPEGVRLSDRVKAKVDFILGVVQGGGRDSGATEASEAATKEAEKSK